MKSLKFGIPLFLLLVALDQATKIAIQRFVPMYQGKEVIGNFFRITQVTNPGGAFSTKFGGNLFYIIIAFCAATAVTFYLIKNKDKGFGMNLALFTILSGAVGNLIDRVRLGYVVDWLDMGIGEARWPTYNIADSAIVIGLIILIFAGSTNERDKKNCKCADGNPADPSGQLSCNDRTGAIADTNTKTDTR